MELKLQMPFAFKRGEGAPNLGDNEQQLMDLLHGKYYALTKAGMVFSQAVTPVGLAIPIYTGTALAGIALWNPPGSGVNVIPLTCSFPRTSGTAAFAAIGFMVREEDILSGLATAGEITAFTQPNTTSWP